MVKVLINGVEVDECPVGWQDFTTTLRIDPELRLFMEIADTPLTFLHEGYRLLKAAFDANGYCFSYPIQVLREDETGQYLPIFDGTLFFKDIEWQEGALYYAKCTLTDNSFFAKIQNNKNLKAKIFVGKSKSGLDIDYTHYGRIRFFNPTTGTYYSHLTGTGYERNDVGFRVYDLLEFLVAYMSDGEVDFVSDYFGQGGIGEGAMITCGIVPRFTSGAIGSGLTQEIFEENFPDLSFSDVIKELDKVYFLGLRAGQNGSRPFLRVEANEYLYPDTQLLNIADIETLKRKVASDLLPAKVKVGSEVITDETFLSAPAKIRFQMMNYEEYAIVQDCNTDREEDWVNTWIIDSNTIEDNLINPTTASQSNDNKIMLINCIYDFSVDRDAVKTNWLAAAPPYYYNELFINANKAKRHLKGVPASIAAYLGTADDTFTARNDVPDNTVYIGSHNYLPVEFEVEITDPSSNYNPATYEYQAPSTGVYTFYSLINFILDGNVANGGIIDLSTLQIVVNRYDSGGFSGGVLLTSTIILSQRFSGTGVIIDFVEASGNIVMNATDKAVIKFVFSTPNDTAILLRPLSLYQCIGTANGGGVYQEYDPTDFPIIRNQFDYGISYKEFRDLKANPLGLISFNVKDSKTYFAWIEEVKYKHFQPQSSFTLISNEKIN